MATKRGPLPTKKSSKQKNILRRKPGPNSKRMLYIEDVVKLRFLKNSVSLKDAYPLVAAEWCYEKNCGWGPENFSSGSNVSAWWKCNQCKFNWQTKINNRTNRDSDCPQCFLGETTDLRDYPNAYKQFDYKRNKNVDPHCLPKSKSIHWQCEASPDHRWQSRFAVRTDGVRCPYCRGILASRTNNLSQIPKLAKQFHPTKNGTLTPKDVTIGSAKPYWWLCNKANDHAWRASIKDRLYQESGCPYCANQLVCRSNSLAVLYPKIAREWHPSLNTTKTPKTVVGTSDYRAWWQCKTCKHAWQARVVDRTKKGSGCPACDGKAVTTNNSLASNFPNIASEWHPKKNGKITPHQVHCGSHKKFWFKCNTCKFEWNAVVESRTRRGYGCPECGKAKLKLPRKKRS